MTITGCLLSALWLLFIPLCMGAIPATYVEKKQRDPGFMWITGYVIMWAIFQIICVPIILLEDMGEGYFSYVAILFGVSIAIIATAGVVCWLWKARKKHFDKSKMTQKEMVLWIIFGVLLGIQLVASVTMRYADGDDAFYVAVANLAESSNTMYKLSPYDSGALGLSARYGLAPFPIWIAFLSRVTGVTTATMAHTVAATVLIAVTYAIYGQIATLLFADKREVRPLFLSMTALLTIFGNYSIYTKNENVLTMFKIYVIILCNLNMRCRIKSMLK